MTKESDFEKKGILNHHLSEVRILDAKIETLESQALTLRKERTKHYVEIGVLERELGIYQPEQISGELEGDGEDEQ